jgi:hypothetical protein
MIAPNINPTSKKNPRFYHENPPGRTRHPASFSFLLHTQGFKAPGESLLQASILIIGFVALAIDSTDNNRPNARTPHFNRDGFNVNAVINWIRMVHP